MNRTLKIIITAVLAAALICVMAVAQNAGVVTNETPTSKSISTSNTVSLEETATQPESQTATQASSGTTQNSTSKANTAQSPSSTTKAGTTKTESSTAAETSTDKAGSESTPSQATTAATATTAVPKSDSVTLTIDCTAANGGYLLKSYRVKYKDGDSAYDILKRACNSNEIYVDAIDSEYNLYVTCIGQYKQKEYGSGSGWLYYVNGTLPMKSCALYKVKPGDNIRFYFTVG